MSFSEWSEFILYYFDLYQVKTNTNWYALKEPIKEEVESNRKMFSTLFWSKSVPIISFLKSLHSQMCYAYCYFAWMFNFYFAEWYHKFVLRVMWKLETSSIHTEKWLFSEVAIMFQELNFKYNINLHIQRFWVFQWGRHLKP